MSSFLLRAVDLMSACSVVIFYTAFELAHAEEILGQRLWPDAFVGRVPALKFIVIAILAPAMFAHLWLPLRYGVWIMANLKRCYPRVHNTIAHYHVWLATLIIFLIWILQAIANRVVLTIWG